jgi:phage I-like protein
MCANIRGEMSKMLDYVILADPSGMRSANADDASDWFTILKTGEWNDTRYGKLTVTKADLDQAVSNFDRFKSKGVDLPIDYDHSFALSGDSKAAGWYTALRREGGNLQARVKWTPDASQAIQKGEYRFFSSEYDEEYSHEDIGRDMGFAIVSGGLTNRPAVKGMGTVALSEGARNAAGESLEQLGDMLGFDVKVDTRANIRGESQMGKLTDDKGKETPEDIQLSTVKLHDGTEIRVPSDSVDTVKAMNEAAKKEADDASAEAAAEKKKREAAESEAEKSTRTLTERIESTEKKLHDERFLRVFTEARRAGRVDNKDATQETWKARSEKFGLDEVESLLKELPADPNIALSEAGSGGEDNPDIDGDAKPSVRSESGRKLLMEKAQKLVDDAPADKPIALSDALIQIEGELDEGDED